MKETIEQLRQRAGLTNEHIDQLNAAAWELRYVDTSLALQMSQEALELSSRNDYRRGRAFALRNISCYQVLTERYTEAERALTESQRLFSDLADGVGNASVMNMLGVTRTKQDAYEAALENYSAALQLRQKSGDNNGVAVALNKLGMTHDYFGDHFQALEYHYRALQAIDSRAPLTQAQIHANLGNILWRVGEAEEAIE